MRKVIQIATSSYEWKDSSVTNVCPSCVKAVMTAALEGTYDD